MKKVVLKKCSCSHKKKKRDVSGRNLSSGANEAVVLFATDEGVIPETSRFFFILEHEHFFKTTFFIATVFVIKPFVSRCSRRRHRLGLLN